MLRQVIKFLFGVKPIEYISPRKSSNIVFDNNWIIVDIRPMGEFNDKYLIGTINIPQTFFQYTSRKKIHPRQNIALLCRNGRVSPNAFHLLKSRNYNVVKVIKGGISAMEKKYPQLIKYDSIKNEEL